MTAAGIFSMPGIPEPMFSRQVFLVVMISVWHMGLLAGKARRRLFVA
jgi:hypothetical protein